MGYKAFGWAETVRWGERENEGGCEGGMGSGLDLWIGQDLTKGGEREHLGRMERKNRQQVRLLDRSRI